MKLRQRMKGVSMQILNLFQASAKAEHGDQRGGSAVSEKVELPEYGTVEVGYRLVCEGEGCPRPQLRTLKALDENERGVVIEVITDNPSVVETVPSMMDMFDGQHLATVKSEDNWRIYVRREI